MQSNEDVFGVFENDPTVDSTPAPSTPPPKRLNWQRIWKKYESEAKEEFVGEELPRDKVERLVEAEVWELPEMWGGK